MYNLQEYSDNYCKRSGSLWQFYRDEPFINNNGAFADFLADNMLIIVTVLRWNLKQK